MTFAADVPTEHASRYLQQLCKHWSHRFSVSFDPAQGTVALTGAELMLRAEADVLHMTLTGTGTDDLPRLCGVVTEHLKRFAFREDFEVVWHEAAPL